MVHPFPHERLLIATFNQGKLTEFQTLLKNYVDEIVSAKDLNLPEPPETGATFEENALLKACQAATQSGLVALSDDSGLCVTALGGDPGLYSARWAGPTKDFKMAMERIEKGLTGSKDRSAYFISVLALAWPDGYAEVFEGRVYGTLVFPPRGTKGFGYDPLFVPEGETETFGEMDPSKKDSLSHRGRSLQKLLERVRQ